jgi:NAD(P)-dependent dehydrogenase (short-subunit alcohol dehydrogenase family)
MGDVLVVTGGSRGIGAATALAAARQGYDVCVAYQHRSEDAATVVDGCRALGVRAESVRADVSREEDVLALFAAVDGFGPLRGLVNNAGIVDRPSPVAELTADRIERMLRVNVVSAFLCAREAVRRMSTDRGGTGGVIVNVSSRAATLGSPNEYVDYAASKAAMDTLTIGLAAEVAQQGIRVNGVRPGIIDTEIHASGGQPDRVERLRERVPLRRAGRAEEIADAIVWLLSDRASYVTGALLDVGGGR